MLTLLAVIILFIAAMVQGVIGFGFGMVSMALLPWIVDIKLAVPMVALFGICVNSSLLFQLRHAFRFSQCLPMIAGGLFGLPAGVFFLKHAPERMVQYVLGVAIIAYVLWSVLDKKLTARSAGPKWGFAAGLTGGALGGAFNASGPPVVMYLATQPWKPDVIKATMQGFFFFASLTQLLLYGFTGILTREVWLMDAKLLPAVLAGVWFGAWLSKRIRRAVFQRLVLLALLILGLLFLFR